MTEEKKEEVKTSKTKTIVKLESGSEVTIEKLKVGKYYKAQKIYSEILGVLQNSVSSMNIDYTKFTDKDGKSDLTGIEKELKEKKVSGMTEMFTSLQEVNPLKLRMVALIQDKEVKEIEDTYFPDDVDKIYKAITEMNDFMGNLKNSVALTANLEGKKEQKA